MMWFFILLIFTIVLVYWFLNNNHQYWKRRNVSGPQPWLFFGNFKDCFFMKKSIQDVIAEIYNDYPEESLVGVYKATTPTLIIRDPDIIKDITIKDFSNFHDNELELNLEKDPIFGRNPFFLRGDYWKLMRKHLTPCFTSGKMKIFYPLLQEVSKDLVAYLDKQAPDQVLEAKELCVKFTLNNVASCAFGIDGKCFEDPYSEFKQIADAFLTPGSWDNIKLYITGLIPALRPFVSLKLASDKIQQKIIDIVMGSLKYREENNLERNDFLHYVNQLKKTNKDYSFTDIDVAAQVAAFLLDGYETSSGVMSFLLFELANNPEIQARLRDEVNDGFVNGILSYEALQKMEILNAVFNESLRLHSPLPILSKICTSNYTFEPKSSNGLKNSVTIRKGTTIVLPVAALHHDSKYFDNPNAFQPERFMETNKENITKFSFLPFGEGPRACLGQRFGQLQLKLGVAHIVRNFKMSVNKRTSTPLKYVPLSFLLAPLGGIWLNFEKIEY